MGGSVRPHTGAGRGCDGVEVGSGSEAYKAELG